ncbi:GRB2-associated-binding protein 1 isoform X3 [Alosa sapidissima]|uniref:GRB2-associated-binding protein 1 isoform X3 n=1 Tax=Alosa sapidissima TaxID=34773 RepID=UPI001C0A3AB0|nr:GRB2-associated-binding protein 1 isoform X3 [Alosa sapidissima]
MSGGDVVHSGWLRKSPPEKKLRRYAWKKRWFVLRSGRLTGDPDVLEYYKNDHAKKPIRVIDLNLCEQVDAGLTFNKKDLEHSFIFDIKTIDRVFYLVADTEEEMNKWVRCICDICGFNPTDSDDPSKVAQQSGSAGVDVGLGSSLGPLGHSVLTSVPPPYQPVSVSHLESSSSLDEPQDYLWLVNCESKKPDTSSSVTPSPSPGPPLPPPPSPPEGDQEYLLLEECESRSSPLTSQSHGDCSKSTSSEPDCNDNLPLHRTPPTACSSAKHTSVNGFFPSHSHPSSASSAAALYDSPPSRHGPSLPPPTDPSSLYQLPRSRSQDTVMSVPAGRSASESESSELYVFNTPGRKPSLEAQLRNMTCYDIPPTPGSGCSSYLPWSMSSGGGSERGGGGGMEPLGGGEVVPPPRPPKPSLSSSMATMPAGGPPERSPTDTYAVPRSISETDGNYCVPTSAGNKALRSNTIGPMDTSRLRKDFGSQDCYDIPRPFASDKCGAFEFNESLSNYFKNKGMMPVSSASTEEVDENYVPMSANSPSHRRSGSLSEPIHEPNYVPMTPGTVEFSSLGKQVPPPAHMGFRSSPKTPPRRPMPLNECQPPPVDRQPPPVDRNLKPDRKGQSPKVLRAKPVGLERTDSQTIGEFPRRRKARPAPLEIKPLSELEEFTAPVRSPDTRTFAREEESFYCTVPITPIKREMSGLDQLEENLKLSAQMNADGGSSPMVPLKGDKQVEYLDLDLDPGKSTPPRKKKSNGTGAAVSDERVDYVVVDQQRTLALKSTREAWTDGRQSTETDTPIKGSK